MWKRAVVCVALLFQNTLTKLQVLLLEVLPNRVPLVWGGVGSCFAVCYCPELCFKVNPPQNTTGRASNISSSQSCSGDVW